MNSFGDSKFSIDAEYELEDDIIKVSTSENQKIHLVLDK